MTRTKRKTNGQGASKKKAPKTTLLQDFGVLKVKQIKAKDHGYEYTSFMVEGRDGSGLRIRKKFKDAEEAKTFATANVERVANDKELRNAVSTDLDREQIAQAESAFRRLKGRYSLDEVIDYFLRHFKAPDKEITLTAARKKFLDFKENEGRRERSIYQLDCTLKSFAGFIHNRMKETTGVERECLVHEISSGDVEAYLDDQRNKKGTGRAKYSTWNGYRSNLSSFFRWCSDKKRLWCSENPVTNTTRFEQRLLKEQRPEPEILDPEQAEALLADVATFKGGAYAKFYALLLFAGLRPTEAVKLAGHEKREQLIDLDCGEIELPAEVTKTRRKRTIEIQPNLKKWLEAFPGKILPPKDNSRSLQSIRKRHKLTPDVCRHSFFTYFVASFDSYAKAARQGGNSEHMVKEHYESPAKKRGEQAKKFWTLNPPTVENAKIIQFKKSA